MCQQATSARSSLIRPLVGAGPQHHGCTILDILASFLQHSGDMFSIVSQLSWFRLLTVCWSLCNWKHMFHGTRRIMFPACCSQKTYRGKNATRGEVLPGVMLRLRYFFLYSFDFSTFESYTCCTVRHLTTKSCGNCFTLDLIQRMNRGCNTCTKIYINAIISLCVLAFYSTHEIWNETDRGVKVLILSFSLKLFISTQDAHSSPPNQVSSSIFGCSAGPIPLQLSPLTGFGSTLHSAGFSAVKHTISWTEAKWPTWSVNNTSSSCLCVWNRRL